MKRITFHDVECDGKNVDFEVHDNGEVVVAGHDIEADEAAYALGLPWTQCLLHYWHLSREPMMFLHRTGIMPDKYRGVQLMWHMPFSLMEGDWPAIKRGETDLLFTEAWNEGGVWFFLSEEKDPRDPQELKGDLSRKLREALGAAWDKRIHDVYFDPDMD